MVTSSFRGPPRSRQALAQARAVLVATPVRLRRFAEEYLAIGLVSAVIALVVVRWVGQATLYAEGTLSRRALLHEAILTNALPPDVTSWGALGANGTNIRIATVWFVDRLHGLTGLRLDLLYQALDLVAITIGLLLVYRLMRHWHPREVAASGVLLLGALLPMTMFFHFFHPWDRPAFVLWSAMVLAAVSRWWPTFFVCFALAVVIKFDSVFAAGLPVVLYVTVHSRAAPLALSASAAVIGLAIFKSLNVLIPGGVELRDLGAQFANNFSVAQELGIAYPPLLMHGLLTVLGGLAWRDAPPLMRRLWVFGLLLLVPHAVLTNFVEVRAQVGSAICMLPLAMLALSTRGSVREEPTLSPGGHRGE